MVKEPFAEHSIATCKGSSGAPIFFYIFNHDTGEVDVDEAVYFLHFYGEEVDGKLRGKAVSFSTIIRNLQLQATHKELGDALAEAWGGGGGVLQKILGRGVRPASQNPYPIYDQNLRFSLPYL